MTHAMLSIPWPILVGFVITLVCAVFIGGLHLVRQRALLGSLRDSHDVAGFAYGVVGVVYAVLLGFMVLKAYDKSVAVHDALNDEARVLLDLGHHSLAFPDSVSQSMRIGLIRYANTVIEHEWPEMAHHAKLVNDRTSIDELWHLYLEQQPVSQREYVWFDHSINLIDDLSDARLRRQVASHEGIRPMMWGLLIVGGMIVVFFLYLFEVKSFFRHALFISLIAGSITFVLLVVLAFDHPFTGPNGIEPTMLDNVVRHLSELP